MSAETFVFTQPQSGALPTELSEGVFAHTYLHYLTLINEQGGFPALSEAGEGEVFKGGCGCKPTEVSEGFPWCQNRRLHLGREGRG